MSGEFPRFPEDPLELKAQAEQMIATARDPVERGWMMVAAIEEGAAVMPQDILSNSATVAEIHVQENPYDASTNRLVRLLKEGAIKAYADNDQFAEADELIAGFRGVNTGAYFDSICEMLERGHAGPGEAYTHLGIEELRAMAKVHLVEIGIPENGSAHRLGAETQHQLTFISQYMASLGRYGVDVFHAEGEHGDLLPVVHDMSERTDSSRRYENALFELGKQYAAGNNLHLATQCMQLINRLVPRAELGFDILDKAGGVPAAPELSREVLPLIDKIEESAALDGNPQGIKVYDIFKLRMRHVELIMRDGYNAIPLMKTLEEDSELREHAEIQLDFHLNLYRRTGNDKAREISLGYLSHTLGHTPKEAAGYIRDIAEADLAFGRTIPNLDNEPVPMVCRELDQIFWGDRKFQAQFGVEDFGDLGRFQSFLPEVNGVAPENVYGPNSALDGNFIDVDIQMSREARDCSKAALVRFLAEHDMPNNARRLLAGIETPTEQVRAMVALAGALNQAS
jgi:hypothetical protein